MKSLPTRKLATALLCRSRRIFTLGVGMMISVSVVEAEPVGKVSSVVVRKAHRSRVLPKIASRDREFVSHRKQPMSQPVRQGIPRARVVQRSRVVGHTPALEPFPTSVVGEPPSEKRVKERPPAPAPAPIRKSKQTVAPSNGRLGAARAGGLKDGAHTFPASPSPATLVRRCDVMALKGLRYDFGSEDPASGGLDCSGAVQYLLQQEGISGVPRTAYTQYQWLKKAGALNRVSRWSWSKERVADKIRAGDLMFWTGTYHTGRIPNISHVMIYLGKDATTGKHYMFGASSRKSKGVHGHAVDVYEFVYPRKHGKDNFAGFGSVPGLRR